MNLPVYLKEQNFESPRGKPFYYLAASNGFFMGKEADLYSACVKVDGVPGLLPHRESLQLKIPKLPKSLMETGVGFFSALYRRYKSEGILLLFFSRTEGFRMVAPRQTVYWLKSGMPSLSVDYENLPTPEGFYRLGTFHSHGNYPACHSSIDQMDEQNEDGLHIVIGDIDLAYPSFSFSFMVNGNRFFLEKDNVIEGYDRPILPPPEAWVQKVRCVHPYTSPFQKRFFQKKGYDLGFQAPKDGRKTGR